MKSLYVLVFTQYCYCPICVTHHFHRATLVKHDKYAVVFISVCRPSVRLSRLSFQLVTSVLAGTHYPCSRPKITNARYASPCLWNQLP